MIPEAVLGIILFLAGTELALAVRNRGEERVDRFIILGTAAFAVVNVGIAMVFGLLAHQAARRGWLKL
jgi:hypothetical protein